MMPGLGRIFVEDPRDKDYAFTSGDVPRLAEMDLLRTNRFWWSNGWWGDQGETPHCVAYAFNHWLADGPVSYSIHQGPPIDTTELYCEAQKVDPWPGDCTMPLYDGTSVRAGAAVLKDWGLIKEYRWINDIDTLVNVIFDVGPVIVGTQWRMNMYNPGQDYILDVSGSNVGGHAYLVNGIDTVRGVFRIKNSWGRRWGKKGHAYIRIEDMENLLRNFGEACIPLQKGLPE